LAAKPSISTSSWLRVCSRSSWLSDCPPLASADGVELVDEDDARAVLPGVLDIRRMRAAPTPAYISTKSEPLAWMNGTPASPAIERASRVLPVPGGPTSSTPFGMRPPMAA
jgi:hypothetical protein